MVQFFIRNHEFDIRVRPFDGYVGVHGKTFGFYDLHFILVFIRLGCFDCGCDDLVKQSFDGLHQIRVIRSCIIYVGNQ